jgi:hypothetical protein
MQDTPNIPGYRTEAEQALFLGKTARTLRNWRVQRLGPPWACLGRTIIYPKDDSEKWLRDQVQQPVRSRRAA